VVVRTCLFRKFVCLLRKTKKRNNFRPRRTNKKSECYNCSSGRACCAPSSWMPLVYQEWFFHGLPLHGKRSASGVASIAFRATLCLGIKVSPRYERKFRTDCLVSLTKGKSESWFRFATGLETRKHWGTSILSAEPLAALALIALFNSEHRLTRRQGHG
jgi:hypothetical protein